MKIVSAVVAAILCGSPSGAAIFNWYPSPPSTTSAMEPFFEVGAEIHDEEEEVDRACYISLFKNGALIASSSNDDYAAVSTITAGYAQTTVSASWVVNGEGSGIEHCTVNLGVSDVQSPTAPGGLVSSNYSATSFVLNWASSTDDWHVAGYEISVGAAGWLTGSVTSFSPTGLQPGSYQVNVRAKDDWGNWSAWSGSITVILIDSVPPSAPSLLQVTAQAAAVNLSWSGGTDDIAVTGFDICRTLNGVTNVVGAVPAGVFTYSDTHFLPNTGYSYHIKAKDAAGNRSIASNTMSITTVAIPDVDSDGFPDQLEALFQIQTSPIPAADAAIKVKPHRPY